jgi:hypothetical protein
MGDAEPTYATLWPLGRTTRRGRPAQAGLEKLSGARIALLWDHLFKGDEILRAFAERLGASSRTSSSSITRISSPTSAMTTPASAGFASSLPRQGRTRQWLRSARADAAPPG